MPLKFKYLKEKENKEALVKNQYDNIRSFLIIIFCLKRCAKKKRREDLKIRTNSKECNI